MNGYLAARPRTGTSLTLCCFHPAGAGASTFARWTRRFGPAVSVVPVRLPGRESRLAEPGITDVRLLLKELDDCLGALLDAGPYAFYGHSLGALVAYRFAEHRVRRGRRPPEAALLGACAPPHLPSRLIDSRDLTDDQLLGALRALGGLPNDLLTRPAWLRAVLATTRSDLTLGRALRAGARRPLPCPVWAFAGPQDRIATPAAVAEWKRWTTGPFHLRTLPGGHFFVRDGELPRLLQHVLAPLAGAATDALARC